MPTDSPSPSVKLGILSDTHGRPVLARKGLALLLEHGASVFAHCGDVSDGDGAREVLDELTGHDVRFVWGNNDFTRDEDARYAADLGLTCLGESGVFELAGKQIGVTHGDRKRLTDGLLAAKVDYLLTGHTHVPHDRQIGPTRWINPGALWRARPRTVALLDLATDELRQFVISD